MGIKTHNFIYDYPQFADDLTMNPPVRPHRLAHVRNVGVGKHRGIQRVDTVPGAGWGVYWVAAVRDLPSVNAGM